MTIVVASASWCAPCAKYKKDLEALKADNPGLTVEIVDADKDKDRIREVFGEITQLPWTAIFVGDEIRQRFFGATSKTHLLQRMSSAKEA